MKILSIDLPWSATCGIYGFAWVDTEAPANGVVTEVRLGSASDAAKIFSAFACQHGQHQVVLIDQPVGLAGTATTGYRPVERAFGNSSFVSNGPRRIQAPRFQPGAAHAANGLASANAASHHFGEKGAVVVESFPQLSILPLVDFALNRGLTIGAVTGLAAHKRAGMAAATSAQQLVGAFAAWSGLAVVGPAMTGQPDAVDALLGLLPALELLAPSSSPSDKAAPCWLHCAPPGAPAHPSAVRPSQKSAARALWMSPLAPRQLGRAGVRADGILSLQLPGWPTPSAPSRTL